METAAAVACILTGVGLINTGPVVGYKLWEHGPRYSFDDNVSFYKRFSLVNRNKFWLYSSAAVAAPVGIKLSVGIAVYLIANYNGYLNYDHIAMGKMIMEGRSIANKSALIYAGLLGLGFACAAARTNFHVIRNFSRLQK